MTAVAQWAVSPRSPPVTLTLGNTCPGLQCGVTLVLLQSAGNWKTIGGREALQLQDVHHSTILSWHNSLQGLVSIHVSDASLGNAANVSVSVGDTNNVLCWRVLAAVLGAAVKMIKLIRPSSGRCTVLWPSKQ